MPTWLPWACAVFSLAGTLFMIFVGRYWAGAYVSVTDDQPAIALPSKCERAWTYRYDEDYLRDQLSRNRDRAFDLSMRVYELETENKRLAFELRCYRCLESVRACKGRFDTLQKAAENGMGC